ncbi:MAG: oligopeptide transporter, OPT family [Deltaproteobacteria bacterium]|nr:oligopeptide transporter, OPT family [Deltaproteobacteria bacterium]
MEQGKGTKVLPDNAYRKLEPGETYEPIVAASDPRAEITPWSVGLGVVMVALFSAACIYMALRAGNAIEAAIPIAIMAVFFGKMRKVKATILENVMVQSIGQASGVVAAGAAFVIPALYINQLQPSFWQIFLACAIGGFLGTALIIPLRKYFVADQHGELPFPEATATNEILVSGEATDSSAGKVLIASFALGGLYDFLVEAVHPWNSMIGTRKLLGSWGERLYQGARMEMSVNAIAALFGLGYIIGLRYAAIIAAGSVLAYVVLVPLIFMVGSQIPDFHYIGQTFHISAMSSADIFKAFVKPIGIGAIAVSGIIGMIRMGKIIVGSVSLGVKGLFMKSVDQSTVPRTARDMNPKLVILIQAGCAALMGLLFFVVALQKGAEYTTGRAAMFAAIGVLVGFLLSFLFTPVAAQAIAIVGTNPVSGMTLITLAIACATMAAVGLKGNAGMFIVLVIGCAVCTALSTSGALVTDFKIGYWIGSTPKNQQKWKFLGVVVASLVVAAVIPAMDSAYHFLKLAPDGTWVSNSDVLPAPQANMLAAITKGLMSDAQQPLLLYGLGGLIAIMLYMAGVPMLAFALGMYLPISINTAVLAGAFVAWLIGNTGKNKAVREARASQGTLIASGLMAGAAIFGIVTAVLRLDISFAPSIGFPIRFLSVGEKFEVITKDAGVRVLDSTTLPWYDGLVGQGTGLGMYILLALACYALARWGAVKELKAAGIDPDKAD